MDRAYDIFEILPDGAPIWRLTVAGLENATRKLQERASQTPNEVRLMHLPERAIIATMNVPKA